MNVFGGVAVSMTFTHTAGFSEAKYSAERGEVFGGLAHVLVRRGLRDRTHACIVLARARLVVRHLPDQVLGRHAGRMLLMGCTADVAPAKGAECSLGPRRLAAWGAERVEPGPGKLDATESATRSRMNVVRIRL